jgi:protein ImuA
VDNRKPADLSWMIEQALKCKALAGVVGEISELDLAQSRRLQLAVEQSRVPCFLHRRNPRMASSIASVCRWEIHSLPSSLPGGMPGVGFSAWEVILEKVRNGSPGQWKMQWIGERFEELASEKQRRTGRMPSRSGVEVGYERSVS